MLWINFLHLYQPANTESIYIHQAVTKSYRRLVRLLEKKPNLKMTMNITGCLLERLHEEGYQDLINCFKDLVDSGRLELVGSAAFHGFLPRLPLAEVKLQIEYQEKVLSRFFNLSRPAGFFLPEMAYHPDLAELIAKQGYRWLILDEISWNGSKAFDPTKPYRDKKSGLTIIFRQRQFSNAYPPDEIKRLRHQKNGPDTIITAADGELYGLRHNDPTAELERIVFWSRLKTITISEFIDSKTNFEFCQLRPSSWESSLEEIKNDKPFILWDDPDNQLHVALWGLVDLAISTGQKYSKDKNYQWYRWHLSRGLASCWFWWASAYDFTRNFGPLAWNPDEVERGVNDLLRAVRSFESPQSLKEKLKMEDLVFDLRKILWTKHWKEHWPKKEV